MALEGHTTKLAHQGSMSNASATKAVEDCTYTLSCHALLSSSPAKEVHCFKVFRKEYSVWTKVQMVGIKTRVAEPCSLSRPTSPGMG
jgi:hypothetical protein